MLHRGVLLLLGLGLLATPAVAAPQVLFDQAHGERFLIGGEGELDLSKLNRVFIGSGLETKALSAPLSDETLSGTRALVISGPFIPLVSEEVAAVKRFVEGGGRLVVMLHVGPTLSVLLREFGVVHSNGVIRETQQIVAGEPLNFTVTGLKPHPVFNGLTGFNLYGAWALDCDQPQSEVIARSGPQAWVDLNGDKKLGDGDAVQSFGVTVAGHLGSGEFVIFGDDAIFQNRFLTGENEVLAGNLARWLVE